MSRSELWLVMVVSLVGGCVVSRTNTTAGAFVTDLRVTPTHFVVTTCELGYEVKQTFDPLSLQNNRSDDLEESSCRDEHLALSSLIHDERPAIPERCRSAIRRWETTGPHLADVQRRQLWSEIPADCQAAIQGGGS